MSVNGECKVYSIRTVNSELTTEQDLVSEQLDGWFDGLCSDEVKSRMSTIILQVSKDLVELGLSEAPATQIMDLRNDETVSKITLVGEKFLNALGRSYTFRNFPLFPSHAALNALALRLLEQRPCLLQLARGPWNAGPVGSFDEVDAGLREYRIIFRSKDFQKVHRWQSDFVRRSRLETQRYVDALFGFYSRLLIVRVDFAYRDVPLKMSSEKRNDWMERIYADRSRFVNNMDQNGIFRGLVGWMMKMEYGLRRGFHVHAIFFFNGDVRHGDVAIAFDVGRYWQDVITKGEGTFYACNAHADRYAKWRDPTVGNALGMIHRGYFKKRAYLMRAILYIIKEELYAKVLIGPRRRIFFKGEMPTSRTGGVITKKRRKKRTAVRSEC
jgi:hypothetical protein